jgi:hypothetical protein
MSNNIIDIIDSAGGPCFEMGVFFSKILFLCKTKSNWGIDSVDAIECGLSDWPRNRNSFVIKLVKICKGGLGKGLVQNFLGCGREVVQVWISTIHTAAAVSLYGNSYHYV